MKQNYFGILQANKWCTEGVELLASQQIERCQAPEFAEEALRELDEFLASSEYSRLGTSRELRTMFEDVITPETKGLVQQVRRFYPIFGLCLSVYISFAFAFIFFLWEKYQYLKLYKIQKLLNIK